jgi:site-specific recombinase XerD
MDEITPNAAVERYLEERKPEVAWSTYRNHRNSLRRFREWCEETGVEDLTTIDGFDLHDFKMWRREQDVNERTLYNNLCTLRVFVQWAAARDLLQDGLADQMLMPDPDTGVRTDAIDADTAEEILSYYETYEPYSRRHATFAFLWSTGLRGGATRAIDLDDYHSDERYVELHHRPDEDTPLKNDEKSEREVNLHKWLCDVLDGYIQMHREDVTDDYGREPLFSTTEGRIHRNTLRCNVVALTRPCHYTNECPHDREIDDCEAANYKYAGRCPSSVSPHDIRRSSISHWLDEGHRKELVSERMDVGTDTLDEHYDVRTEEQKRRLRREEFDMDR